MSLKISSVDIGCGIRQISGFTYYGGVITEENGLTQLLGCLYTDCVHPTRNDDSLRLNAGAFLFSDRERGMGNKIAALIRRTWPHHPLTEHTAYNPHSHNNFTVYVWSPDIKDLIQHPLWKAAKLWAARQGTDRVWGRNVANPETAWKPQPMPPVYETGTEWQALT